MDTENIDQPAVDTHAAPLPALPSEVDLPAGPPDELSPEAKRVLIIAIIAFVVIFIIIILCIRYLLLPTTNTARYRDVFIILMAITSIFTSLILVVMLVQLARLLNLMQNELKPMLISLNETISHLRGTTTFLSDNLAEPVIKANQYLVGLSTFFQSIGLFRKSSKKKPYEGE